MFPQNHDSGNSPTAQDALATTAPEALRRALAFHQAGRLDEAARHCRAVLAVLPDQFDALHLLGVVEARRRHFAEAQRLLSRARSINPRSAEACSNHVLAPKALGRFEEALASSDAALAIKPDYVEAHYNRGVALVALKRYAEALASYDRALAIEPDAAEALYNRGALRAYGGRHEATCAARTRGERPAMTDSLRRSPTRAPADAGPMGLSAYAR